MDVDGRSLAGCEVPLASVWAPRVIVLNERQVNKSFAETIHIGPDGLMEYQQRFQGEFTNRMNLRDFPMDRQTLTFRVVLGGARAEEIALVEDERTGGADEFSIADWTVSGGSASYEPFKLPTADQYFPQVTYRIEVRRNRAYYAQKVFLPLILIVCMSWAVFWIDPHQIGPQIALSATSMLTLIAYQFALIGLLPRISYLTRADRFVLASSILVFLALVEAVSASALVRSGRAEQGLRLDKMSRVAFPVLLGVIIIFSFVV